MRIKNKELRRRRHRKEQAIKLAIKEAKGGTKKPKAAEKAVKVEKPVADKKPAAKKPAAKKPAAKKPAAKKKAEEAPAEA